MNDCPDAARSPEAACWRLVDCGAIAVHRDDEFRTDWNNCVERLWDAPDIQQRLMMACIASATCDQLKSDRDRCFAYGDN